MKSINTGLYLKADYRVDYFILNLVSILSEKDNENTLII